MEGVGRVSEAGAGEVGVCESTAATPWSLLLEPLGFFIGTKNLCIAFTRKYYDFLTLFIACETVSVCFSVTVTEAARFVSVNRAVAFSQSKYCNFTGVILWLVGAFYSPYSNFSTQSPPQIAFNQYTNRKNESRCLYLHSDWVGKTDVWVGLAHPCPCLEPALIWTLSNNDCMILRAIFSHRGQLRDSYATITEDSNAHWCSRRKNHALRAGALNIYEFVIYDQGKFNLICLLEKI